MVGIEGAVNLGIIARTCVNFNVKELYLVNPSISIEEALRYSARGRDLLLNSVVTSSLEDALRDVDLSIATSAIGFSEGDIVRQAISIDHLVERIIPRTGRIALIFGRESTGLTREELLRADFLATIPANPEYPVLNISQAVAIFLWEIWKRSRVKPGNIPPRASREDIEKITRVIGDITRVVVSSGDKVRRCELALRRVLYRSALSMNEARVILYWARRVARKLGEKTS
ncbi:MAG: TrmH family RNA methyltransferase [Desulfurococcaceae archaeon]